MNKYGLALFRSFVLEVFYDIYILDEDVKKKKKE